MIICTKGVFKIQSQRKKRIVYDVWYSSIMRKWLCSCPDFKYRREALGEECKHIHYVKLFIGSADRKALDEV